VWQAGLVAAGAERRGDWLTGALAHRSTVVLAVLALIAIAYGGSLRNELVFDERIFMERDPRVQTLAVDRIFLEALWSTGEGDPHLHQYYRPLQLLPLALSHAVFGTAAWPSHLLSLAVHFANCLLVLGLLRALLPRAAVAGALVLLFAVHPGYSEAVLWVSDIAGLGAACCTLAVVRLHLSPRRERWWAWVVSPLLLLGGLLFKESGLLAVVLVAAYDLVGAADRGPARLWRLGWRYAVFLPPLVAYAALRWHALGGALPGIDTVPLTRTEMVVNAVALLPSFVRTFLWPFDLNMYHDFDAIHAVANARFAAGAAIAALWAVAFVATVRRARIAAYGMAWAAAAAAPHLLIRWPQLNVFAERYLYLPTVGILLAGGALWCACVPAAGMRRVAAGALAGLLALFVAVDIRRTADWRDELTIYGKTLTQSARAELIRINLAVRLLELERYDAGVTLLEELQRIDPQWPEVWHNLGLLYLGKGDRARALQAFEEAARRDPFKPATQLNLGYLYDQSGRRADAVRTYLGLVRRAPGFADGWYNLAAVALESGQYDNARTGAERVLALRPGDPGAQMLLARATAAQTAPHRGEATAAETLARCNAARRDADAGRVDEAILSLLAAAWLDEDAPLPHHYLANLYYLQGRLSEALAAQREALRRAPDSELYKRNLEALEKAAGHTPLAVRPEE
jgi:tetratricopeptide (TPR) repeat protein